MVGKIKRVREKLHQAAVKLDSPPFGGARSTDLEKAPIPVITSGSFIFDTPLSSFPSGIFAGTQISPEALVQTLKFEEPSNDTGPPAQKVPEEKKQQTKKEKMKERRDRWLNKISSIKLAKEQQVAQAKRAAMPVVGDMRPLADALPELCQLIPSTTKTSRKASRKNRVPVKKKPEPTDFSLMKPAQKRKLLESETSRFSEAVKNLAHSKTNPLAAIGEHLRKRLKQEEEQGPS
ncbi:ribosome biogenesis protein SLX9 homolog isoform X2 [Salvelinus fontinalis]|uniref:ribosome biogenesis protein SLX9 homolog isoform X2 n=1 Tax=Salvelinus fontinalis TaxID=8038 RepID=UPI0024857D3E|nr:ribosome biogenesis protein SLX9 homolog isoform X2 [Salvelinus fontinalis]